MLTKISGYTTKFLFYVRNNFLSFIFKLSVFLTLLTLIYLVCVLRQSNSVQKGHQIEVQQIARSQKLISRIPTRTESPVLPTEKTATIYNLIPKGRGSGKSNSFFSIPESTTFGIVSTDTTSSLPPSIEEIEDMTPAMMSIDATSSVPFLEPTTTPFPTEEPLFQDQTTLPGTWTSPSLQELEETTFSYDPIEKHLFLPVQDQNSVTLASQNLDHTTYTVLPTTTAHPLFPIQAPTTSPTEKTTYLISTLTPERDTTELMETTPIAVIKEATTSLWDLLETTVACTEAEMTEKPTECAPIKRSLSLNELRLFGNAVDSIPESTTAEPNFLVDSVETDTQSTTNGETTSSIPELTESNEPLDDDDEAAEAICILPTHNPSDSYSETGPSDTYFQDDEDEGELNGLEADHTENPEPAKDDTMLPESNEGRLPPLNTDPFGLEDNFFNLFNLDHLPAMSNINPTRWSSSGASPSKPGQVNTISQIADSADEFNDPPRFLQRLQSFRPVNSLLNMKIKDSVSLLHRLFSNFRT